MSRYKTISRPGEDVPKYDSPGKKPRQDRLEEFDERLFSKHFYEMQSIHLAFGSTYLNGEDWVKKTISQVFQITHSQWIYRNFLFHDIRRGYLRRQDMKEMMVMIETFLDTRPDGVSTGRKCLLEFDHGKLVQSNMHD